VITLKQHRAGCNFGGIIPRGAGGASDFDILVDQFTIEPHPTVNRLPTEAEVEPWFTTICRLWDDAVLYESAATRGRDYAVKHYSEAVSRLRNLDYLTSLKPGQPLFALIAQPSTE
jgi:hypothetical protein